MPASSWPIRSVLSTSGMPSPSIQAWWPCARVRDEDAVQPPRPCPDAASSPALLPQIVSLLTDVSATDNPRECLLYDFKGGPLRVPPRGTGPARRVCGLSGPTRRASRTSLEQSSTRSTKERYRQGCRLKGCRTASDPRSRCALRFGSACHRIGSAWARWAARRGNAYVQKGSLSDAARASRALRATAVSIGHRVTSCFQHFCVNLDRLPPAEGLAWPPVDFHRYHVNFRLEMQG